MRNGSFLLALILVGCVVPAVPEPRASVDTLTAAPDDGQNFVPAVLRVELEAESFQAQALPASWDTATVHLSHPTLLKQPRSLTLTKNTQLVSNGSGGYVANAALGSLRPGAGYTLTVSLWNGGAFSTLAGEKQVSLTLAAGTNNIILPIEIYSALSISTFNPASGGLTDVITLSGAAFSVLESQNAVTLGGSASLVSAASNGSLTVSVPDLAPGPHAWEVKVGASIAGKAGFMVTGNLASRKTYVTYSGAQVGPTVAFGPNEYLVVWSDNRGTATNLYGIRVAPDGTAIGSDFAITSSTTHHLTNPGLAYSPTSNRYLAVMRSSANSGNIVGQLINANGTPYGSGFNIESTFSSEQEPQVTYDSTRNRFAVVWIGDGGVYARFVAVDGTLSGGSFQVDAETSPDTSPAIAYSPVSDRYLSAWEESDGTYRWIRAKLIRPTGSVLDEFTVSTNSSAHQVDPTAALDTTTGDFLVVWVNRTNPWRISGRRVSSSGSMMGSEITISNASGNKYVPRLAYEPWRQKFVVAWRDGRSGNSIWGRYVGIDGTFWGGDFGVSATAEDETACAVAADSTAQRALVVVESNANGGDSYGQLVR